MAVHTLQDSIVRNIKRWNYQNMHTAIPATVLDVSQFESNQLITVQPVMRTVDDDGVIIELPNIICPVQYPSGGGGILSFPIAVGDTVTVMFCMMSMSEWLASEGGATITTPSDRRKFAYTDAVAIPCIYTIQSNLSPDPKDVELKFNGSSFKFHADENGKGVTLTTDADVKVECGNSTINAANKVTITSPDVEVDGDLSVTGDGAIEGGFGCNALPAQGPFALGAPATDLGSVIALANNIRLALLANGIGV